ncbi:MAG: DUF3099 domain-containing protein [Leucobacter sp.]
MAKSYSVTSAGVSAAEDRAHRMRVYFIAMTLRLLCVASLFFVRGWWVLLVGAGAVLLPYYAVMIANAVAHNNGSAPDAPAPRELEGAADNDASAQTESTSSETLIVVDSPAERRTTSKAGHSEHSSAPANDESSDDTDRSAP